MPMFESDDISINYQITGDGPRVLFFNGSGATLQTTELLLRSFTPILRRIRQDQRQSTRLRNHPPSNHYLLIRRSRCQWLSLLDGWAG